MQDLKALNDEVKELASKIKQGYAARDNAIAAGEAKLACDFQVGIILSFIELKEIHNKKVKIFQSHGMLTAQQRELEVLAALDKLGESEYSVFNRSCR